MDDPVAASEDIAQARLDDIALDRHEEIERAKSGVRVLTYTKTYRIETKMSDEQVIEYAKLARYGTIDSLVDALDLLVDFHHRYGTDFDDEVTVEVHNSQVEERDPGFF